MIRRTVAHLAAVALHVDPIAYAIAGALFAGAAAVAAGMVATGLTPADVLAPVLTFLGSW